ncbi:hypothetical protein CH63R_03536 [Colletotrichum higginsianum IMI 349063]|uniref:Uncharacterized protein n=1 Tax=Colletotrichum higginsianum (strain IMI 349063) TaxID=759273 RepID=A0A1B7YRY7_COLHI|nr:hypothetical protein CH63R_03536 [Colletotrichum higginsianum IMI 349063]OBR14810.1 hypothetical protein CH63R_03536 [Colletotrichum higginsianum IMI 349063]
MDICNVSSTAYIGVNSTSGEALLFRDFDESRHNIALCGPPTYLRPDPGGCLLPWPYTMAWILIHLPVTVLRVTRWEKVQTLSIILAFFSVYFTVQAYTTYLIPAKILVWMPLALVLDIGAMMQLVFLIVDENGATILRSALKESIVRPFLKDRVEAIPFTGEADNANTGDKIPSGRGLIGQAWLTVLALTLLAALLVLQIIGLVAAVKGRGQEGLKAEWCSPMFQSAEAVLVNCETPPTQVEKSFSQGIGCISLPADEQYHWLNITVVVLLVSVVFEIFDAAILVLVGNNARWWRARMKRPWFTMFTGNAVLLCILVSGVISSSHLPIGVNRTVWVFKYEQSVRSAIVCQGTLMSAGVRGSIIGWTDGFLSSWGSTYTGF